MTGVQLREHTLNRVTFGPSPDDRARYDLIGHERFIDQQLGLDREVLGSEPEWTFGSMHSLAEGLPERIKHGTAAMMYRAITEERQLEMVLGDLFYNHLNMFAGMGIGSHTFDRYLNEAIEDNVLGKFADMLFDSSKQPAMLHYLDNKRNAVGANNENYAREVMELHTLGVGNFDEDDVKAATRVLTGWGLDGGLQDAAQFEYDDSRHDKGAGKVVLNVDYSKIPDGEDEITQFLGMLARHPATARRIVRKLIRRFYGEQEAGIAVRKMGVSIYSNSGTSISAVTRHLLSHAEFTAEARFRARIKPPHRFVISAFRAFGLSPTRDELLDYSKELVAIGDKPYFYGPPTGYPDDSAYWLTANGMLGRFKLAEDLAGRADVKAAAKSQAGIRRFDINPKVISHKLARYVLAGDSSIPPGDIFNTPLTPAWSVSNDTYLTAATYAETGTTLDERVERALTILFSAPEFSRY